MKKWRIFINFGYQSEFELTQSVSFDTKKEAEQWAREHKYPLKCVMRADKYDEMCGDEN